MNYGRFFRLNQSTSKIEDGIAIYDYIDLPAFFNSSTSNTMSPKYPISVTITESSVKFCVHFNVFRVKTDEDEPNQYYYDIYNACRSTGGKDSFELKHTEEVILELPYREDSTEKLYENIKEVYSTKFPLFIKGIAKLPFIMQLIRNRYDMDSDDSPQQELYRRMREHVDGRRSYSTIWLMGLAEKNKDKKCFIDVYKDHTKSDAVGFLRKLLLDFMFDLQHSKVFQTSKYCQEMYAGLMANFYFSALMHKCDYYYYRGLINDVVEKIPKMPDAAKKDMRIHLSQLYAENLSRSETLWMQDVMSCNAEKYFNDVNPKDKVKKAHNPFKRNEFSLGMSWFADPEEEMRRIYFAVQKKDDNNNKQEGNTDNKKDKVHLCNVGTLVEYLKSYNSIYDKDSDKAQQRIAESLMSTNNKNRTSVSQWFLKRFAFADVLHLHISEYSYLSLFLILLLFVGLILFVPEFVCKDFWNSEIAKRVVLLIIIMVFIYAVIKFSSLQKGRSDIGSLLYVNKHIVQKRKMIISIILLLGFIMISVLQWVAVPRDVFFIVIVVIVLFFIAALHKRLSHWLSNIHIFFPRLVASITAAWLSLAIGNELFKTFFDAIFSWSMIFSLTIIVFIFVCYEINKIMPQKSIFCKLSRSGAFVIISYAISFVVGLFVINFTGEKMLERSGCLKDFYCDYVNVQVANRDYLLKRDSIQKVDITKDHARVSDLQNIKIETNNKWWIINSRDHHTIATVWEVNDARFFILRDFLIQFAFVAMFIGVFIQMIFEEKQLTEV